LKLAYDSVALRRADQPARHAWMASNFCQEDMGIFPVQSGICSPRTPIHNAAISAINQAAQHHLFFEALDPPAEHLFRELDDYAG